MTPRSKTLKRERRAWPRAFAMVAATAALVLQVFVVQTHTHVQASLGVLTYERLADHTADGHRHVSATHEQGGCIVCQVFATSGQSIGTEAAKLSDDHNAAYETDARTLRGAPRALSHSWHSRAPPIAL